MKGVGMKIKRSIAGFVFSFLFIPIIFAASNQYLLDACKQSNFAAVKRAIAKGEDIEQTDWEGKTPLIYAVISGSKEIVEYLLEHGAKINGPDPEQKKFPATGSMNFGGKTLIIHSYDKTGQLQAKPWLPLMYAVQKADFAMVRFLVNKGADTEIKDSFDRTAIDIARENGYPGLARYLRDKPSEEQLAVTEQLLKAVEKNDLQAARTALDQGADINAGYFPVDPPLIRALSRKFYDLFESFLDQGADILARGKSGKTVLMCAVNKCNENLIERLINKDPALIDLQDNQGMTALHYAAQAWKDCELSLLIKQGASLEIRDKKGKTALIYAVDRNDLEKVRSLVENKAEINVFDKYQKSPLMYAAQKGNYELFKYLTDNGADIKAIDSQGNSLLIYAALSSYNEEERIKIIKYLLEQRADIDLANHQGETALLRAVSGKAMLISEFLIKNKAKVISCDQQGRNLIARAALTDNTDLTDLILNKADYKTEKTNQIIDAFHAVKKANKYYMADYLAKQIKGKVTPIDPQDILFEVLEQKNLKRAKYAVSKGASVNKYSKDGKTPLYLSTYYNDLKTLKYLISKGAKVNAPSHGRYNKETPLMRAARSSAGVKWPDLRSTKILVNSGADINAQDAKGYTPLMHAVLGGSLEAAKYLVSRKANTELKTIYGETALDIAENKGYKNTAAYLRTVT